MRRQWARSATAIALALALLAGTGAAPANATARPHVIGTIVTWAQTAYSVLKDFFGNKRSIEDATRAILDAISTAKTELINHIDQVAITQAKACAHSAVDDFADIERFTPDTLQAYARDSSYCVNLIDSQLSAITDKSAVDQLGFALHAVAPIAQVARSRAGFSGTGLLATVRDGSNIVIAKLEPECHVEAEAVGGPYSAARRQWLITLVCTGYNGTSASKYIGYRTSPNPPVTYPDSLKDSATNTTSRIAARTVLPLLP